MEYQDYEKVFSPARLNKYLVACGGDSSSALILYRHNIRICQKFYGILNVFEVALRNAVNDHYIVFFSDSDWIRHHLDSGGMLENHPQRLDVEKLIDELDKTGRYTNDRVVSSVSFGFWTHLFSRRPYALGGSSLLNVFPGKAKGQGQRHIYNELQSIKSFRNRIAHHEAICFDASGNKSMRQAKEVYSLVLKYVQFLGYSANSLFYGLDMKPEKIMQMIDKI